MKFRLNEEPYNYPENLTTSWDRDGTKDTCKLSNRIKSLEAALVMALNCNPNLERVGDCWITKPPEPIKPWWKFWSK